MTDFEKIVVEPSFNCSEDSVEFGEDDKVMRLNRFLDGEREMVGLNFELGRKEDDTITLALLYSEFITKLNNLSQEP